MGQRHAVTGLDVGVGSGRDDVASQWIDLEVTADAQLGLVFGDGGN